MPEKMTSEFQQRAVDHPKTVVCPACQTIVDLPKTEPWLTDGHAWQAPALESIRCPQCRRRIYLTEVTEAERQQDAEWDAFEEDEFT